MLIKDLVINFVKDLVNDLISLPDPMEKDVELFCGYLYPLFETQVWTGSDVVALFQIVFINHSDPNNGRSCQSSRLIFLSLKRPIDTAMPPPITITTSLRSRLRPVKHKTSTNTKFFVKFKFLNRNMNIDFFIVVFKTILTNNAMKLMESEDVEPFSHFDVVFKTILTDNAEDVVFKTILKDVLVDDFVNTKVNTSKRPISISPAGRPVGFRTTC